MQNSTLMIKNKIKTINYITKGDHMKFQTDREIAMREYERLKEEHFELNHQIHRRTRGVEDLIAWQNDIQKKIDKLDDLYHFNKTFE